MALQILTTDSEIHELQRIVNVARPSTERVTVPKEALRRLLADHHTLYSVATGPVTRGGRAHKVGAGDDQESMR